MSSVGVGTARVRANSLVRVEGGVIQQGPVVWEWIVGNAEVDGLGTGCRHAIKSYPSKSAESGIVLGTKLNLFEPTILGTATFDVTKVDPSSVKLLGVSPLRSALEDVATPFTGALTSATSCTTAGPDSFTDLALSFSNQAISAVLGPVPNRQALVLTLTGNLLPQFGGAAITGQDVIVITQ